MEKGKTIKGMHKKELVGLIEQIISNINKIDSFLEEVETKKGNLNSSFNEIYSETGYLKKIINAKKDAEEKLGYILDYYNEIFEGDEKNESIKNQITDLLDYYQKSKEKIKDFRIKVFGGEIENENGEKEKVEGLEKKIEKFYSKQEEKYKNLYSELEKKYNKFYSKIEDELEGGATTVNLSKAFADKVKEYKESVSFWSGAVIILLGIMVLYYGIKTWDIENITSYEEAFKNLLIRAPFLGFVIWLGIFLGNRRAESKKLEESYKHKEVMARSFVGYKKMLENIEESEEDKELLKKHMENLLNAISNDSSVFINTKGERYPFFEIFKKRKELDKSNNIN